MIPYGSPTISNTSIFNHYYELGRLYELLDLFKIHVDVDCEEPDKDDEMICALCQIQQQMHEGKYKNSCECADDIRLMWKGLIENPNRSLIAGYFSKRFERCFQIIQESAPGNIYCIIKGVDKKEIEQHQNLQRKPNAEISFANKRGQKIEEDRTPPKKQKKSNTKTRNEADDIISQNLRRSERSRKAAQENSDKTKSENNLESSNVLVVTDSSGNSFESNEKDENNFDEVSKKLEKKESSIDQKEMSMTRDEDRQFSSELSFLLMDSLQRCKKSDIDKTKKRSIPDQQGLSCKFCNTCYFPTSFASFHVMTKNFKLHLLTCENAPSARKTKLKRIQTNSKDIKRPHCLLYKICWNRFLGLPDNFSQDQNLDVMNEKIIVM